MAKPEKQNNRLIKLKEVGEFLSKFFCVLDDLPFLWGMDGILGPLLLVGAGLLIFPVQAIMAILKLRKALLKTKNGKERMSIREALNDPKRRPKVISSLTTLGLSIVGFLVSGALLGFILVKFALLGAIASVAIPTIMTIISGVELVESAINLKRAKIAYKNDPSNENAERLTGAKRKVIFRTLFLGFGLGITGLATLGVISGLAAVGVITGVASFGIVPSAILVGVVIVSVALKAFEIIDKKRGHRATNAIKRFFDRLSTKDKVEPVVESSRFQRGRSPSNTDNYVSSTLAANPTRAIARTRSDTHAIDDDLRKPLLEDAGQSGLVESGSLTKTTADVPVNSAAFPVAKVRSASLNF